MKELNKSADFWVENNLGMKEFLLVKIGNLKTDLVSEVCELRVSEIVHIS